MLLYTFLLLLPFNSFAELRKVETELKCEEYHEVVVKTECKDTTIKRGLVGGVLGGVAGGLLFGKKGTALGALGGAGVGAAGGKQTCHNVTEKRCLKWVEVPVSKK